MGSPNGSPRAVQKKTNPYKKRCKATWKPLLKLSPKTHCISAPPQKRSLCSESTAGTAAPRSCAALRMPSWMKTTTSPALSAISTTSSTALRRSAIISTLCACVILHLKSIPAAQRCSPSRSIPAPAAARTAKLILPQPKASGAKTGTNRGFLKTPPSIAAPAPCAARRSRPKRILKKRSPSAAIFSVFSRLMSVVT